MIIDDEFRKAILNSLLIREILVIVIKEHPEILTKATIQVVDQNPELFKEALEKVKKDAQVHKEDNATHGV